MSRLADSESADSLSASHQHNCWLIIWRLLGSRWVADRMSVQNVCGFLCRDPRPTPPVQLATCYISSVSHSLTGAVFMDSLRREALERWSVPAAGNGSHGAADAVRPSIHPGGRRLSRETQTSLSSLANEVAQSVLARPPNIDQLKFEQEECLFYHR